MSQAFEVLTMENFDDMYAAPTAGPGTKRRFDWSGSSSASPLPSPSRMLPVPPPPPPPTMKPLASNSGSEVAEKRAKVESETTEYKLKYFNKLIAVPQSRDYF